MVQLIDRRSFLTAGATAGAITIAGCGQDSESSESETEDGETNSTEGGSETDDSTGAEETQSEVDAGDDGASFDLNLTVGELPDAFESLTVEFTGFSFFSTTGSTVSWESEPVQADLVEVASSGGSIDLMETNVPADEYDSIDYFITVTDTTMSGDDGEQTFRGEEDGEVDGEFGRGDGAGQDSLDINSGGSVTVTAEMSIQDAFDWDWKFEVSHSIDRES